MTWVLALDAGTSSLRAGLFDAAGEPLGEPARAEYPWRTEEGAMEADAEVMLARCVEVIDAALVETRRAGAEIAAVAMDTFWHGLVGVGADGRAATPLFGWGDVRAAGAARELAARLDPAAYHHRTGCWVHATYPAAKLLWLRGRGHDSLPRAGLWLSLGELLTLRFFGEARASISMASGTGLFGLRSCAWDDETLEAIGMTAAELPAVSDDPLSGLKPEWARRWPELAEVPWFPALGDGACASLGSGAFGPGRVGLTVGTSAALRVLRTDPEPDPPDSLWCYRLDALRTVSGRALSNGGNAFAWLAGTLALPEDLDAELDALPPDGHGLTVAPGLLPERPPALDPDERAALHGVTLATTPLHIARAWLEAVAYRIAGAAEAVEAAYGPAAEVVASGGALHASPTWTRIIADVLGRPVRLAAVEEGTARGAALLIMERLRIIPDLAEVARVGGDLFPPDAARHEIYRDARARQEAFRERKP
ncbi:MAG TPA: gluconokinase [Longimicrobium sp.]